jgi:glycolate oxidase
MDGHELVERLRRVVGERWLLLDEHDLRTYESDGLLQYRQVPRLAVLPGTAEEVRACVAACAAAGVPWVARGAGSGLSGGALPVKDGVLIVLSRLNRILEIDLDNGRVCVEPGVTNAAVSAAVAPDFFYPPDPSSQIVCTIGGNVAENSGGAHCFKYGFTTNYVTGLEVVLADGTQVTIGGKELDSPGYDLLGAFVGSEGTLGVATKIWLRVVPVPEATRTLVAFFDSTRQAGEAVSAIVQAGIVPGAIEMMDATTIRATEEMAHAGYPVGRGAALLVELDGAEAECEAQFAQVTAICVDQGSDDVRVSRDEAERQLFWKTRKAAFPAMGRISPNYFVQDGVVPRTTLPDVLVRIDELAAEYGLVVANVFHAGDGNLHPLVCFDATVEGQAARAEELAGRILDVCLEAGGSITGEHGVGVDKRKHMAKMFGEDDLAAFQRLRCAFDPDGRANPGKVMPTPRLCGEVPGVYRQHPLEAAGIAERF